MFSYIKHIQEVCKPVLWVSIAAILSVHCGKTEQPSVEPVTFTDRSVSFQNGKCSTQMTLVNEGTLVYTLAFLNASFTDDDGHKHTVQLDQNGVIEAFDPVSIAGGGISRGNVIFDLSGTALASPISASVIIVGVAGSQVAHFVGDFTCR